METKKTPKASLEKRSNLFLGIGFITACTLAYFAVNFKSETIREKEVDICYIDNNEEPIERIIIEQPKPPEPIIEPPIIEPPKPQTPVIIKQVRDETDTPKNPLPPTNLPPPPVNTINGSKTTVIVPPKPNGGKPSTSDITKIKDDIPYRSVTIKPIFPGCQGKEGKDLDRCNSKMAQKSLLRGLEYPEDAMNDGRQGKTWIKFIVNKSGSIEKVTILKSSKHQDLDQAASEAVSKIFNRKRDVIIPGKDKKGNSVNVEYQVPVKFRLAE
ncbi:hypothetical protein UJ101_01372 [Flavobacteriaceae bacterium UJ101]|nr:hypothetical protein UJ101_01372 [Flavobacteriaceae bacterium UJ101]